MLPASRWAFAAIAFETIKPSDTKISAEVSVTRGFGDFPASTRRASRISSPLRRDAGKRKAPSRKTALTTRARTDKAVFILGLTQRQGQWSDLDAVVDCFGGVLEGNSSVDRCDWGNVEAPKVNFCDSAHWSGPQDRGTARGRAR